MGSFFDRWARSLLVGSVLYAVLMAIALLAKWGGEPAAAWISAWGNFPLMAVMLLMALPVIRDRALSWHRRRAFQLLFVAQLLDLVASVGWGYGALTASETWGAWPDVVWNED